MMKIIECEQKNGLLFYPYYNEKDWDINWLNKLPQVIKKEITFIGKYIDIDNNPTIILIPSKTKTFLKDRITSTNEILIVFDNSIDNWQQQLRSHIFEFALLQYNTHSIPKWFLSALKIYIRENLKSNKAYDFLKAKIFIQLQTFLKHNFIDIRDCLLRDSLDQHCAIKQDIKNTIIRIIGVYIIEKYKPKTIKKIFLSLKLNSDFKQIVEKEMSISVDAFLESWNFWIEQKVKDIYQEITTQK